MLAVAAIAPNVLQVFAKPLLRKKSKYFHSQIQSRIMRLQEKGWIEFVQSNGVMVARLTARGRIELLRYRLREKSLKQAQWDGLWRMIIFDIREYKRGVRDRIRRELKLFGFCRLQQSVWVYPYDCQEIISLLKADYHIGKELLYIVATTIENDRWLKREFNIH